MNEKDNKLEQLRQERDRLFHLPLDGMTLGEAQANLKKLQDVEFMIAQAERRSPLIPRVPHLRRPSISPVKEKKSISEAISELNLGRYVMTVLAAGLCLLALGIFVLSFWGSLPDVFKFLLIMAVGTVLECFGFWRAEKLSMRAFFLGLAGLGSGTLYIALVSGSLVWNLYGTEVTAIGLLAWFILHVWLALHKKASIFYVIAYIGGSVTVWLASLSADRAISGELMLIFLLLTIVGVGELGAWRSKSQGLVLANMLFCLSAFSLIRANYRQGPFSDSWYEPQLLPWVMIVLAALCLLAVRRLVPQDWKHAVWLEALATFIACAFVSSCVGQVQLLTEETISLVTTAIIVLCGVKSCSGYLIGAAIPLSALLGVASWHICGCNGLLPALAAAAAAAVPGLLADKGKRTGVVLFYLTAVYETVSEPERLLSALAVAALMAGLAAYCINTARKGMYFRKPIDLLVMAVLPGILLTALRGFSIYLPVVPVGTAIAGLIAYDYFAARKGGEENLDRLARALWAGCMIAAYLLLVFGTDTPYRASEIMVAVNAALKIFCFAGLSVYRIERARNSRSQISAVLSVLFMHLNLYWSVQAGSVSFTWVIVSLVGLALSAALILCGFRWRCKPMRQTALICSILYVVKMAFVDIRLDDGIKAAGALLIAGLLCFGISFAYHKLSLRYAAMEDVPS